jgi:hypothetical protein
LKAYSNLINIDNLVSKHSNLGIKWVSLFIEDTKTTKFIFI